VSKLNSGIEDYKMGSETRSLRSLLLQTRIALMSPSSHEIIERGTLSSAL
jgi:hypothetical protein